jgi:hypothetical protein
LTEDDRASMDIRCRAPGAHDAQRSPSAAAEERSDEGTASKRSALAAVGCKAWLGVSSLWDSAGAGMRDEADIAPPMLALRLGWNRLRGVAGRSQSGRAAKGL